MTITRLKAKNQLTIPQEVIKKLRLKRDELFAVEVDGYSIKLIPVEIEPKYTAEEVDSIDRIVEKEKSRGKPLKAGKKFAAYIKKVAG